MTLHFVGHKNLLHFDEVENLVQIFNFDMDEDELKKLKNSRNFLTYTKILT
jgi:hypothetical protein